MEAPQSSASAAVLPGRLIRDMLTYRSRQNRSETGTANITRREAGRRRYVRRLPRSARQRGRPAEVSQWRARGVGVDGGPAQVPAVAVDTGVSAASEPGGSDGAPEPRRCPRDRRDVTREIINKQAPYEPAVLTLG